MAHIILRLPAIKARTALSRSSIYKLVAQHAFPQPVRLGLRSVGWLEAEIDDWLERRVSESRNSSPRMSESKRTGR